MTNTVLQRKNMVESQIRPSDVTDRRITAAMTVIPREPFLPANLEGLAYSDESLTIASGRKVFPPRILAKLIQLAEPGTGDSVLVISESGYAATLIAQLAAKVVALLPDEESAKRSKMALSAIGTTNVIAVTGPAMSGWPADAPYDVVLVEGGIEQVPEELKTQIRDNGRLVAIAMNDRIGHAVELHKRDGVFARREAFQAEALPLSGFMEARPAFVF